MKGCRLHSRVVRYRGKWDAEAHSHNVGWEGGEWRLIDKMGKELKRIRKD